MKTKSPSHTDYLLYTVSYYFAWFATVYYAGINSGLLAVVALSFIIALQLIFEYWHGRLVASIPFAGYMLVCGSLIDTLLYQQGVVVFNANPLTPWLIPPWMMLLWFEFGLVFYILMRRWLRRYWLLAVLALVGFYLAYLVGYRFNAVSFPNGQQSHLTLCLIWSLALPSLCHLWGRIARHQ